MMVLPFIFVPFIISFPAGLVLYWITTNFWTIGQQYVIQRADPGAGRGYAGGGQAAKPPPPPPQKEEAALGAAGGGSPCCFRGASCRDGRSEAVMGLLCWSLAKRLRRQGDHQPRSGSQVGAAKLNMGFSRAAPSPSHQHRSCIDCAPWVRLPTGRRSPRSGFGSLLRAFSTSLISMGRLRSSRTTSGSRLRVDGRRRLRAADRQTGPDDRRAAAARLPGGFPRDAGAQAGRGRCRRVSGAAPGDA